MPPLRSGVSEAGRLVYSTSPPASATRISPMTVVRMMCSSRSLISAADQRASSAAATKRRTSSAWPVICWPRMPSMTSETSPRSEAARFDRISWSPKLKRLPTCTMRALSAPAHPDVLHDLVVDLAHDGRLHDEVVIARRRRQQHEELRRLRLHGRIGVEAERHPLARIFLDVREVGEADLVGDPELVDHGVVRDRVQHLVDAPGVVSGLLGRRHHFRGNARPAPSSGCRAWRRASGRRWRAKSRPSRHSCPPAAPRDGRRWLPLRPAASWPRCRGASRTSR